MYVRESVDVLMFQQTPSNGIKCVVLRPKSVKSDTCGHETVCTGNLGRGKMVWDVLLVGGDSLRGRVGVDTRLYSTADAACTDRENVSAWNSAAEMQGYYYARSGKATCKSRVPSQKRNKDAADGIFYEYASPHQAPQCRMTRHSAVARHLTCSHAISRVPT